jgi:putative transposase
LINIDISGANTAAIKIYKRLSFYKIEILQCKYLNNIVEQDHRMIKWRIVQVWDLRNLNLQKELFLE